MGPVLKRRVIWVVEQTTGTVVVLDAAALIPM